MKDRSELGVVEFLQMAMPAVANMETEIPLPDQWVFKLALQVADGFIDGWVNPDLFQKLDSQASSTAEALWPIVDLIIHQYGDSEDDAVNWPVVVTDAFYPMQIAGFIKERINEDGLVVNMSPINRKLIKSLITDEVTGLHRITKTHEL